MGPMQMAWDARVLEHLRHLAVRRWQEGYSAQEIAEFLDVSPRTVQRWWQAWREQGEAGLPLRPGGGRHPKLTPQQTEQVLGWLDQPPSAFGFSTEQWTAPRLAEILRQRLGVRMNVRYLNDWLRRHGVTPQIPGRQAQERDEELIAGWIRYQWPRIKKRPAN